MKNLTDNYRSTHQAICARVLDTTLANHLGYGERQSHDTSRLQAYAAGEGEISSWGFVSLDFRRADSNANLEVRVENKRGSWRTGPEVDAEGNEWEEYELTTQVGYPSHGSTDCGTVLARVELIREVALLAAAIQAEFGGRNVIHRMTATSAQVVERTAKQAKEKITNKVRSVVDANKHQMRVGSERRLDDASLIEGVPSGTYEVAFEGNVNAETKKYTLFVTEGVGACLMRTA